jgi:hypothetical protein
LAVSNLRSSALKLCMRSGLAQRELAFALCDRVPPRAAFGGRGVVPGVDVTRSPTRRIDPNVR